MPKKVPPIDLNHFRERYIAGEGLEPLATEAKISPQTLGKMIWRSGVILRNRSDAMRVRLARAGADERRRLTEAAHAAVRGKRVHPEQSFRAAKARAQAVQFTKVFAGAFEEQLRRWLKRRGLHFTPQEAFLSYNLDLGLHPIAVEIHVSANNPLTDRKLRKRIKNITDAGRHLIYVWITQGHPLTKQAADEIVSFYDFAKRNPAMTGEYWVIRGTGERVTTCSLDDYKDAIVPASIPILDTNGLDVSIFGKATKDI